MIICISNQISSNDVGQWLILVFAVCFVSCSILLPFLCAIYQQSKGQNTYNRRNVLRHQRNHFVCREMDIEYVATNFVSCQLQHQYMYRHYPNTAVCLPSKHISGRNVYPFCKFQTCIQDVDLMLISMWFKWPSYILNWFSRISVMVWNGRPTLLLLLPR